jgi:GT2 family glycosyltransferase
VDISVIIPTYRRAQKLANCLHGLCGQTLEHDRYEVLVGLDGPDPESRVAAMRAWTGPAANLRLVECERMGQARVRNQLLPLARGRILVGLNDDVRPEGGLLLEHFKPHEAARARGQRVVVTGAAPWVVHEDDRLFDRLVRETSMVFFFDKMDGADPAHDWGFRHCHGLNFSAALDGVREVGGFTVFPSWYGYEDDELAYKLAQRYHSPVLYRPQALVWHDHRITAQEYLEREFKLGYAALGFAKTSPECARAMFNRDVHAPPELSYSREFVVRERGTAARVRGEFREAAPDAGHAAGRGARRRPASGAVRAALDSEALDVEKRSHRSL